MVEEPFVNLRTAIESTRQAVLLKYFNELLELDPKTQPKQITAVTRCVDTLERHSREQEEQQTDNDLQILHKDAFHPRANHTHRSRRWH